MLSKTSGPSLAAQPPPVQKRISSVTAAHLTLTLQVDHNLSLVLLCQLKAGLFLAD